MRPFRVLGMGVLAADYDLCRACLYDDLRSWSHTEDATKALLLTSSNSAETKNTWILGENDENYIPMVAVPYGFYDFQLTYHQLQWKKTQRILAGTTGPAHWTFTSHERASRWGWECWIVSLSIS
jgi:hypothetical protein